MVPDARISKSDHDAVIFDLDGVITKTAKVHAAAWKKLFDEYLAKRIGVLYAGIHPHRLEANRLSIIVFFLNIKRPPVRDGYRPNSGPTDRPFCRLWWCYRFPRSEYN